MKPAAALRLHVESTLAARVPNPFQYHARQSFVETVTAAFLLWIFSREDSLEVELVTEIYGPPCSGKTSVLISALAARTAATSEVCALVDARDAVRVTHSAEGGRCEIEATALQVRCRNVDQALRAADLLIQGGGFGLIALDLSDTRPGLFATCP